MADGARGARGLRVPRTVGSGCATGRENVITQGKERRKLMFYLTTHSTHFIYGYMARERKKNNAAATWATFSWSTGWNEKYLNGSTMRDRSDDPSHHERPLYHGATSRSYSKGSHIFDSQFKYFKVQHIKCNNLYVISS